MTINLEVHWGYRVLTHIQLKNIEDMQTWKNCKIKIYSSAPACSLHAAGHPLRGHSPFEQAWGWSWLSISTIVKLCLYLSRCVKKMNEAAKITKTSESNKNWNCRVSGFLFRTRRIMESPFLADGVKLPPLNSHQTRRPKAWHRLPKIPDLAISAGCAGSSRMLPGPTPTTTNFSLEILDHPSNSSPNKLWQREKYVTVINHHPDALLMHKSQTNSWKLPSSCSLVVWYHLCIGLHFRLLRTCCNICSGCLMFLTVSVCFKIFKLASLLWHSLRMDLFGLFFWMQAPVTQQSPKRATCQAQETQLKCLFGCTSYIQLGLQNHPTQAQLKANQTHDFGPPLMYQLSNAHLHDSSNAEDDPPPGSWTVRNVQTQLQGCWKG